MENLRELLLGVENTINVSIRRLEEANDVLKHSKLSQALDLLCEVRDVCRTDLAPLENVKE